MHLHILPTTQSGKWAVILMVINWALFMVGSILPWNDGYAGLEMFFQNPLQAIISVAMLAAGISTVLFAYNSLVRYKEYDLLVIWSLLLGLYSILGFLGSMLNLFLNAN